MSPHPAPVQMHYLKLHTINCCLCIQLGLALAAHYMKLVPTLWWFWDRVNPTYEKLQSAGKTKRITRKLQEQVSANGLFNVLVHSVFQLNQSYAQLPASHNESGLSMKTALLNKEQTWICSGEPGFLLGWTTS